MTYPSQALIDRTWPYGVTPNWDATRDVMDVSSWFKEYGLRAYISGGGTDDTFVYHHGKYWFITERAAFAFKMRWG